MKVKRICGMVLVCASVIAPVGCSNDNSSKEEEKVTSTMLNNNLKNSLVEANLDGANANVVMKISFRENDITYGLNTETDFRICGNPLKVMGDSTIKVEGTTSSSLDMEMYAYEQEGEMFLQIRDKDGEYVKAPVEDEIKDKIKEYDIFSKKLIDDETANKILNATKAYEYTGKTKINNAEYHTLSGTVEDGVILEWIKEYAGESGEDSQEEESLDKLNLSMYIEYIPEDFGDVGVELYFDQEKEFSGMVIDFSGLVKSVSKDEEAVGKVQIMLGEKDTSDIEIPKAKTVSMQELME